MCRDSQSRDADDGQARRNSINRQHSTQCSINESSIQFGAATMATGQHGGGSELATIRCLSEIKRNRADVACCEYDR
ncbi:hypothetical protein OUZ56_010998 [Daphnia magna]|uniref:Uncharacterized protein n=1 Tax=Daphnia magna TaxID=35525 RepID=A0ABQ9Z0A1_9CRUS|nr:hypothetical protein OUZ56_010998 [Daphnia magna]